MKLRKLGMYNGITYSKSVDKLNWYELIEKDFGEWRLGSRRELLDLIDYRPKMHGIAWTSSDYINRFGDLTDKAYYVNYYQSDSFLTDKSSEMPFILVKGEQW